MLKDEIIEYCLNKNKAYIDYPFGDIPICFKINKKIFAELYPLDNAFKITLKCDALLAELYRKQYPNDIVRGYHCPPMQAIYKNTVYINKTVDDKLIFEMIDHSYEEVIKSFPKKVRKEISENKKIEEEFMKNLEFMKKFRPEELCIKEFKYWLVCVRQKQSTLGDVVILLKRETENVSGMLPEEGAEFPEVIKWYEELCREKFGAIKFNYMIMMMHDPFVHYHAFPRYDKDKKINLFDIYWEDKNTLSNFASTETLDDELLFRIRDYMK